MDNFPPTFQKAAIEHAESVMSWFNEPHVKEFWDNSPEHKADILIFMRGRKEPSPYFGGVCVYWVGLMGEEPYCLVVTTEVLPSGGDLPQGWLEHLSQKGETWTIDFMIGNSKYLGRGLAVPTLEAFTRFVQEEARPSVDTFFIDPMASNPRAKHVYEKAGFKTVGTFRRDWGPDEKNVLHYLMVKNMPKR